MREMARFGYALSGHLTQSTTSEVYAATETATGRRVAIKLSRADVTQAADAAARMQTERNVGRGLRHPHLVAILDGGVLESGQAWLARELLAGEHLGEVLARESALSVPRAVHIMRQVCEALDVLHRRGAVHRGVKPESIFLTEHGPQDHVKLLDLGVLAVGDDDPGRAHPSTGVFELGAPLYLAPELPRGEQADARTDLYAVGGILYHVLAGRPPFVGADLTDVVAMHLHDQPDRLDALVSDLPNALVTVVHRCLEKARDQRPASARELMITLDQVATDQTRAFARDVPSRRGALPGVPTTGRLGDWLLFGESLERLMGGYWPESTPPAVEAAVSSVRKAMSALSKTQRAAMERREAADVAARQRLRARERFRHQLERMEESAQRASAKHRRAITTLDEHTSAVARLDRNYARGLAALAAAVGPSADQTSLPVLQHHLARVEAALDDRIAQAESVAATRKIERAATHVMSEFEAKKTAIRRDLAELALAEQEDGFVNEHMAAIAAEAFDCAALDYQRAALKLLVHFIAHA
jgi:serine/threonine protein kinase